KSPVFFVRNAKLNFTVPEMQAVRERMAAPKAAMAASDIWDVTETVRGFPDFDRHECALVAKAAVS
ncbi:MAG: hypothetical protein ACPHIA_01895, partial [Alphaproteobacteria bacterium]